ncbi:MAG: TIGR04282 family arsenosugar biosynthesis glycosyltransferase [Prochloraceae cyanobacterium]
MKQKESLIIFTRYPEPGKTKTRTIPALGAEGAAQLQRQMSEHTLVQARRVQSDRSLAVEVHFTGGDRQLMKDWLGSDLIYRYQSEGDLGVRMRSAFELSFNAGMTGVAIIGIDCPDLNASLMAEAFEALTCDCDLVLGPAADGGYYLIGLNRLIPELFADISWGTSQVLAQTKAIAEKLELNVYYLSVLNDVDRPEDLEIWQRYKDRDS